MTAATNPWNRLTLAGKIILPLTALVLVAMLGFALLWITGLGVRLTDWVIATGEENIEILRFIAAATGILLFTVPAAFVIIYMELKIIAQTTDQRQEADG